MAKNYEKLIDTKFYISIEQHFCIVSHNGFELVWMQHFRKQCTNSTYNPNFGLKIGMNTPC